MLEEKKPLQTQWDPSKRQWYMSANLRPGSLTDRRKIANFVDDEGNKIPLLDIDKIKAVLMKKPIFQELSYRMDWNSNAMITGGKSMYQPGYLSGQIINFITLCGVVGTFGLPYYRGISFPPYAATEKQTKEFQDHVETIAVETLTLGLATAIFYYITSVINKRHIHHKDIGKEEYDNIVDLIRRLDQVPNEIELKSRVIDKIIGLLSITGTPNIDTPITKTSVSLAVAPAPTTLIVRLRNNLVAIKDSVSQKKSAMGSYINTTLEAMGKFLRQDKSLPLTVVEPPKTLRDWIITAFDDLDDLNIYKHIDETLTELEEANIPDIVLYLLKIKLNQKYLGKNLSMANQVDINRQNTIYDLLCAVGKLPDVSNEPFIFILKEFAKTLANKEKLLAIFDLMQLLKKCSLKVEKDSFHAICVQFLDKSLIAMPNFALVNIHRHISQMSEEQTNKCIKTVEKLLAGQTEHSTLDKSLKLICTIFGSEMKFDTFMQNYQFITKLSAPRQHGFFDSKYESEEIIESERKEEKRELEIHRMEGIESKETATPRSRKKKKKKKLEEKRIESKESGQHTIDIPEYK